MTVTAVRAATRGTARTGVAPLALRSLCEAAGALGLDPDASLGEAGLRRAAIGAAAPDLPPARLCAFVRSLLRRAARPTLALEIGGQLVAGAPLAPAIGASAHLRDAIDAWHDHVLPRLPLVQGRIVAVPGGLWLTLDPAPASGGLRAFVLDVAAGALEALAALPAPSGGRPVPEFVLELPWQAPPWQAAYASLAGTLRFGTGRLAWWVPEAWLDRPLPGADALRAGQARAACAAAACAPPLAPEVAALLREGGDGLRTLDGAARRLGLSRRTLARRLAGEGSSFQRLLEEWRRDEAHRLLLQTDEPVADIAVRLGYVGPSNFSRSVRRWFGCTPGRMRAA